MTISFTMQTLIITIGAICTLIPAIITFVKTKKCPYTGYSGKMLHAIIFLAVGAFITGLTAVAYEDSAKDKQRKIAYAEQQKIEEKEELELEKQKQLRKEHIANTINSMPTQWQKFNEYLLNTQDTRAVKKLVIEKFIKQNPPKITVEQYDVFVHQYSYPFRSAVEKSKRFVNTDDLLIVAGIAHGPIFAEN